MMCMFYFARCTNIISNSLVQLVKHDVHTMSKTSKIKFMHAIFITYYYYLHEVKNSLLSDAEATSALQRCCSFSLVHRAVFRW